LDEVPFRCGPLGAHDVVRTVRGSVVEDITLVIPGGGSPGKPVGGNAGAVAPPEGFSVVRILGRGAMGAVYLARRQQDGELVAVKILSADVASQEKVVERFYREARLMLQLDHPNIVRASDVGMTGGCYYLTMEYVAGETLAALIEREGRIDEATGLGMMRQIAEALAYSERKGVVHRDLKPANVIVREDGVCKLGDMGLAFLAAREDLRLTAAGTSVGTPLYMAPEQASAERDLDTRTDIYSFGCTFFHALCGRPPFTDTDGVKVMRAHLHEEAPRPSDVWPDIREDIEAVILKCMEKGRKDRYQTAKDLVQTIALMQAVAGAGETSPEEPASRKTAAEKGDGAPPSRRGSHETLFPFGGSSAGAPPPA
jgi:serine/threonine-protein kinase